MKLHYYPAVLLLLLPTLGNSFIALDTRRQHNNRYNSKHVLKYTFINKFSPISDAQYNTFGPKGHDYSCAVGNNENPTNLSESDIDELLAQRLAAKLSKEFNTADSIQAELADNGVYVHDGQKEYNFTPFGPQNSVKPSSAKNSYSKSPHSLDLPPDQEQIVLELLRERTKCKQNRLFRDADAIREELEEDFDVYVEDRLKQWCCGSKRFDFDTFDKEKQTRDYSYRRNSAHNPSDSTITLISQLISQRSEAKLERDYTTADEIRDRLREDYGVFISDKDKCWYFDTTAPRNPRNRDGPYEFIGDDVDNENHNVILKLIDRRTAARAERDFKTADVIRDGLLRRFGVVLDDRAREYAFDYSDEFYAGNIENQRSNEIEEDYDDDGEGGNLLEDADLGALDNDEYDGGEDIESVSSTVENLRLLSTIHEKYVAADVNNISSEDLVYINKRLVRCVEAERSDDYDTSYAIRTELEKAYGIQLDDEQGTWSLAKVDSVSISGGKEQNTNDEIIESSVDQEDENEALNEYSYTEEDLKKLTVPLLKEKLREVGLTVGGKKQELIDRLLNR